MTVYKHAQLECMQATKTVKRGTHTSAQTMACFGVIEHDTLVVPTSAVNSVEYLYPPSKMPAHALFKCSQQSLNPNGFIWHDLMTVYKHAQPECMQATKTVKEVPTLLPEPWPALGS
jgi:hypothetical protein